MAALARVEVAPVGHHPVQYTELLMVLDPGWGLPRKYGGIVPLVRDSQGL